MEIDIRETAKVKSIFKELFAGALNSALLSAGYKVQQTGGGACIGYYAGIQIIGSSGTGVNANDGTTVRAYFDGTNFVAVT